MNEVVTQNLQLPPEQLIPGVGRLGCTGHGKAGRYDRPWIPVHAGQGLHLAGERECLLMAKFPTLRERMSQALHT